MNRLLIIRFSAMGDVAMTVPVVYSYACQHPDTHITFLTRHHYTPLFINPPANLHLLGVDLKAYQGLGGLHRLYKLLQRQQFTHVIDLHDVLRTKYLRLRFRLSGIPVSVIQKGSKQKKALIGHAAILPPLPHTINRYIQALPAPVIVDTTIEFLTPPAPLPQTIGIAPFAAHQSKIYPIEKMLTVVNMLTERGIRVILFGGAGRETTIMNQWSQQNPLVSCASSQARELSEELHLMARLQAMLAMDSANMHLAAILRVPTVSIWGATHPAAGFTPWNQPTSNILQDTSCTCRPCSIYGKTPCRYGDYRCYNAITPEQIVTHLLSILNQNTHF